MANKNSVSDWDTNPDNNDNLAGIPLGENLMYPRHVNNFARTVMAQLKTYFGTLVAATTFADNVFRVTDNGDATKQLAFEVSGITTATTRTVTVPDANLTMAGIATTQTLTNKRVTPRIGSTASSTTPAPDGDNNDQYEVTALAAGATFGAPTGTPTDGQKLLIRIKDNGTARSLAWNAIYRVVGTTLPTTTVISKTLYLGCIYNGADSVWDVVAVAQQA